MTRDDSTFLTGLTIGTFFFGFLIFLGTHFLTSRAYEKEAIEAGVAEYTVSKDKKVTFNYVKRTCD